MATVRTKIAYHHGDLRQQLIAATRGLVEAKGPDGFSVSEACRAAGVSTAAPYKHFADRTEMLQAVAHEGYEEMTASFDAAIEGLRPGSFEAISALGVAYVKYAEANPELFRMMFAFKDKTPKMEEAGMACYGRVLHQIAIGMDRTEVDQDVMEVGFRLWAFVHGLSFLQIDGKTEHAEIQTSLDEVMRETTHRLLA